MTNLTKKGIGFLTIIAILIFLLLIKIGYVVGVTAYTQECIIFIILTLFYYFTYEKWNMTPIIFTLLILGHILHCLGIFGFYNISPFSFISWERITHFFGIMPFAMLFFNYFKYKWDVKLFTLKNCMMFVVVFFAATGVGQLVEASEFWGFTMYGEGEGFLRFGHGDVIMGPEGKEILEANGAGWINMGWDVTTNMIGIVFGILIMVSLQWGLKKKKKEIDLYELEKIYLQDKKGYSKKF